MQEERRPATPVHEAWLPAEHPLHRPRHGDKQRAALICAAVFFLIPLLAFVLGARAPDFENRRLADFPSPGDGWGFFTGLSAWATDHLVGRDLAVRVSDGISRGVFGEPSRSGTADLPSEAAVGPVAPAPVLGESGSVPSTGFPPVIEGKDGWLYFGYDVEGKCQPYRPLEEVIANLGRLRAALEASGRDFVLVVPPDKSTAVPQHLPDGYAGKGCAEAYRARFWAALTSQAGAVDLRPGLRRTASRGVPIYHRLDSHWTDAGALVMVSELAEELRPGVSAGWRIEQSNTLRYRADLPTMIGRKLTEQGRSYSLAPDSRQDRTRPYITDMRGPVQIGATGGAGTVDRKVAMLSDSFSYAATRYLGAVFSNLLAVPYATAAEDPQLVADVLADHEVVVLEIVERNLSAGFAPILDPAVIDVIVTELTARPLR